MRFAGNMTFKQLFLLVLVECLYVRGRMCVCLVWFSSGCGGLASASFTITAAGSAGRKTRSNLAVVYGENDSGKAALLADEFVFT